MSLARLHGVETSYDDASGRRQVTGVDALMGVLKALGAPVARMSDVGSALRERRHALRSRLLEPVTVAWEGTAPGVLLRLPASPSRSRISGVLTLEGGEARRWTVAVDELETTGAVDSEGESYLIKRLSLPGPLPGGYHRLTIDGAGIDGAEALVIAAPRRAFEVVEGPGARQWGIFCPPYALHRRTSWGAGDVGDFDALLGWVAGRGGGLVASLPMLATRFDPDCPTASPYAPTSRLFRNEFYLDLTRIPELAASDEARGMIESSEFREAIEGFRRARLIDYGRQMALKRRVLESMAGGFFARESPRNDAFRRFLREHPEADAYAGFMAAGERHGSRPSDWPASLRTPGGGGEVDERSRRYHLFVQWLADEQIREVAMSARDRGLTWYVDFPVGVHPEGYDAWSRPELFVADAAVGCPPDPSSTQGQDWKFPPVHPDRQREEGYRYLIAALRHQLGVAGALRIDHAAGLHRLYWLPRGGDPRRGAYVKYPFEELYAILCLESHRAGAWVVGENLGTLPPGLNPAMERHGIRGMVVAQHDLKPDPARPLVLASASSVACVNTHDMVPFASFWRGQDIPDRVDLGLIDDAGAAEERSSRAEVRRALVAHLIDSGLLGPGRDAAGPVVEAIWKLLAGSPSRALLLNIEDLWLETEPQNTPETEGRRPNWRRKLRLGFEEFVHSPAVAAALREVDEVRRRAR